MRHLPPERIVCLTEETVETLYLLGEDRRIVGVSGYAVRPPRVRKEKPRVSAFTSADRIRSRPGFDDIPAVRTGSIVEIKSPLILQPGPAALTEGLDAIVAAIEARRSSSPDDPWAGKAMTLRLMSRA